MKKLVKICGMRDPSNCAEVDALGVDMMGFIFYNKSPRYIDSKNMIPKTIQQAKTIGLFVDEDLEKLLAIAKKNALYGVQLHGNETPSYCQVIQSHGLYVLKAFRVDEAFDFNTTRAYELYCDLFVFDNKAKKLGGTGQSFDHQLLNQYKGQTSFLLSGGIGPDFDPNTITHPQYVGVDINSRFEIKPGLKDSDQIQDFLTRFIKEQ